MNRRASKAATPAAGGQTPAPAADIPLADGTSPYPPPLDGEAALYRHAWEKSREELQAFAHSISHDLRAPLRAIEGFSRILLEDFAKELSEEPRRFLEHIIANSQHLSGQIDDLLRFYRAGQNPPTRITVNADTICREALLALDAERRKNVAIVQHELPSISADPIQLREIFGHLISNALKFAGKTAQPRIEIDAKIEPVATTFFVRDNGVGFEPRLAGKLFQVFQKLHSHSEYPGNGIGLAIVRRYVEGHGGCVSASSLPGQGSTFSFSLPRDPALKPAPAYQAAKV